MMTITYPIVKNIFDTLPVGYYLGRNINISLSETSIDSAFYPFEDKIVISYPAIAMAAEKMAHIDETNLESVIRGLFYHEISHVIFTPNDLYYYYKGEKNHDIINIFEDERIETLCRDVYMNVDFKRTLLLVAGLEQPTNDVHAFFNLVRFRIGEPYWVDRVNDIINRNNRVSATATMHDIQVYTDAIIRLFRDFIADMNARKRAENNGNDEGSNTDAGDGNGSDNNDASKSEQQNNKRIRVNASKGSPSKNNNSDGSTSDTSNNDSDDDWFDDEFFDYDGSDDADENPSEKADGSNSSSNSNDTDDDDSDKSDNPNGTTDEKPSEESKQPDNSSMNDKQPKQLNAPDLEEMLKSIKEKMEHTTALTKKDFKREAKYLFNVYFNEELNTRMTNIIYEKVKKNRQTGSAINAYSGRLNPRSVGTRDDYRWWTQRNRQGHIKQYSKVHFNLFIDNSGSFFANDKHMNEFIQTLDRISMENADFTFDVITINMNIVEWPNHHKQFHSCDGNRLLNTIADVIRRHQKPACNNYNIVLFDGDAHSDDQYCARGSHAPAIPDEPFKHFDTSNTIIISDEYNKVYIDRANMKNATVRYCKSYCNMFIGVICDLLERAI